MANKNKIRKFLFHSCQGHVTLGWKYHCVHLIHSGKIHELNTLLFIYSFKALVFTLPYPNKQDRPQPHCHAKILTVKAKNEF